jgi:hypothetical protein
MLIFSPALATVMLVFQIKCNSQLKSINVQNARFRVVLYSPIDSIVTERSRLGGFLGYGGILGSHKRQRKPMFVSKMQDWVRIADVRSVWSRGRTT